LKNLPLQPVAMPRPHVETRHVEVSLLQAHSRSDARLRWHAVQQRRFGFHVSCSGTVTRTGAITRKRMHPALQEEQEEVAPIQIESMDSEVVAEEVSEEVAEEVANRVPGEIVEGQVLSGA